MSLQSHFDGATNVSAIRPAWLGENVARVVIVDDDAEQRMQLSDYLVTSGLGAEAVASGAALRRRLEHRPCDVIILDMMLPGEDGLSVLRALMRMDERPGIIMCSSVATDIDRIVALEMGADDFVVRPTNPREFLARIRSVLRRHGPPPAPHDPVSGGGATVRDITRTATRYAFAGCVLDVRQRALTGPDGITVSISDGEFRMLGAFIDDPAAIHSRAHIAALTSNAETDIKGRTVDVKVSRLRRKLAIATGAELIRTVRKHGYQFLAEVRALHG